MVGNDFCTFPSVVIQFSDTECDIRNLDRFLCVTKWFHINRGNFCLKFSGGKLCFEVRCGTLKFSRQMQNCGTCVVENLHLHIS